MVFKSGEPPRLLIKSDCSLPLVGEFLGELGDRGGGSALKIRYPRGMDNF